MAIDAQHTQYKKYSEQWKLITDIIDQENTEDHLIYLNPNDTTEANKDRNAAYQDRAVFYALAAETNKGIVGAIYNKLPEFEAPDQLQYLTKNADGRGNSIYQQSQVVTKNVTAVSREGLYVSFPKTDGMVSQADINNGKAVAGIQHITADRIINWQESTNGSQTSLSLVVFSDVVWDFVDYVLEETPTLRELYIEENIYKERLWAKSKERDEWIPIEEVTPTDHTGNTLSAIPFKFVGSVNNDPTVDSPNMYGLSKLNVAHYRNSADFEDSVWYAGQAQPWMSNVNQTHIDLMKKNEMYIGSRTLLAVPDGGSFGFDSATPNPVVRQAMMDKVDMMIGIGARMITPGGVAKTAEQSANERETQHSTMTLIASNISDAYQQCLVWVGLFMGVDAASATFNLNQDFIKPTATPAELREIMAGYLAGSVPINDYVRYMKDYGVFDEETPPEDYQQEIESKTERLI